MSIRVSGLYCYPVKSTYGFALQTAQISRMGIQYDRQWMVVDEAGMFVAQRADRGLGIGIKRICLVRTAIQGDYLILTAPGMPTNLAVPLAGRTGNIINVQVWQSTCSAIDQGEAAAIWFSRFLSLERPGKYRLVRMPDDGIRDAKHGQGQLAFADSDSFLVISQPSLDDLNRRMPEPLPMDRFRPNIVINGCEPYAEDHTLDLSLGDSGIRLHGETLCFRCPATMTDQMTAKLGNEPLRTLAIYRKREKGVVFGRNFNHRGVGHISIGDEVEVLAWD